jgi:hypothetical protein
MRSAVPVVEAMVATAVRTDYVTRVPAAVIPAVVIIGCVIVGAKVDAHADASPFNIPAGAGA